MKKKGGTVLNCNNLTSPKKKQKKDAKERGFQM